MFGNIGFLEISIIALILLVVFGAKRIPTLFASFGQGIRELKRSFTDDESHADEPPQRLSPREKDEHRS